MKRFIAFVAVLTIFSCSERFDFNVENPGLGLVVEASISDKSFVESLSFPSDGRYFKVSLSLTSDVDNIRNVKVAQAKVSLVSNAGDTWTYDEDPLDFGTYYLKDEFFGAEPNVAYKLMIDFARGEHFESRWEQMPTSENPIGNFQIRETFEEQYTFEIDEFVIKNYRGVDLMLEVPVTTVPTERFVKWSFEPTWVHRASLAAFDFEGRFCWITNKKYLNEFVLQKDKGIPYEKKMFFLQTVRNEFVYEYFSALVHQEVMSEDYFQFWADLEAQKEKGGLFDQPPFGPLTNMTTENANWTVNGYFGVVSENAKRWEMTLADLSYPVVNPLKEICEEISEVDPETGPDQCMDCRNYNQGKSTNIPPTWWTRELY
ncbi:MAG: hypothetical protein ACI9IP_000829 [Arcticibacterium sp.]|jgi:hypothetical protein